MDFRLRQLETRYKEGDDEAGAQLLSAMIRSGLVAPHKAELAAIYQHPVAMRVFDEPVADYGKRDEERILPLSLRNYNQIAPWTCEVYIRRLYALVKWTAFTLEKDLDLLSESLHLAIFEMIQRYLQTGVYNEDEWQRFHEEAAIRAQEYGYQLHDGMLAQHYSWLAVAAAASSVNGDNAHGMVSDSGPAWACTAMAALEAHLGLRDPALPENPQENFGPNVMERAYREVAKELVPWLLDPFPA